MIDCKFFLSLLVNRLLCTFNDLTELGAYIVQGILNTHRLIYACRSSVSKLQCIKLLGTANLKCIHYIMCRQILFIENKDVFLVKCR